MKHFYSVFLCGWYRSTAHWLGPLLQYTLLESKSRSNWTVSITDFALQHTGFQMKRQNVTVSRFTFIVFFIYNLYSNEICEKERFLFCCPFLLNQKTNKNFSKQSRRTCDQIFKIRDNLYNFLYQKWMTIRKSCDFQHPDFRLPVSHPMHCRV